MYTTTPDWVVSAWLNTPEALGPQSFPGRIVVLEAFQMLCPGCVSHGLPTLQRVRDSFKPEDVAVVGLHTVFEHHAIQGQREALEAFIHEYRLDFPIGIDRQRQGQRLPETMAAYELRGTPSFVIFDREGRHRHQHFGIGSDLALGALIGQLLAEPAGIAEPEPTGCAAGACAV
ncbi:MAG: TlpA disulfide reductase family protein [Halieaceae bacterium]|nr:TlpA disulfide reductase family protein [Halieaceae bacterium]